MEYRIPFDSPLHVKLVGEQSYKRGWKRNSAPKGNVCFFMLEGTFSFRTKDEMIIANKSDLVFFKAKTEYTVCAESDCRYFYIHFASEVENADGSDLCDENSVLMPSRISLSEYPEKRERLIWLFSLCERVFFEKPIYASFRLDNIFSELLLIACSLHAEKRREKIPPSIRRIERYIKSNINEPLTLADVADNFSLSKQYIMRSFKKYYNTSVTHMINEEKLQRSLILLRDTDMTVDEIANSLSFSQSSYFCRLFKRAFSLTPTEYRRQIIDG